jgi:hypothetical protein
MFNRWTIDRMRQDVCGRARPIDSSVFDCFAARQQDVEGAGGIMQFVLEVSPPPTVTQQDRGPAHDGSDHPVVAEVIDADTG